MQRSMKNRARFLLSCPQPRWELRLSSHCAVSEVRGHSCHAAYLLCPARSPVLYGCCLSAVLWDKLRLCLNLWQDSWLSLFWVLKHGPSHCTCVNVLSGVGNSSCIWKESVLCSQVLIKNDHLNQNLENHFLCPWKLIFCPHLDAPLCVCLYFCVFSPSSETCILSRLNRLEPSVGTHCKLLKHWGEIADLVLIYCDYLACLWSYCHFPHSLGTIFSFLPTWGKGFGILWVCQCIYFCWNSFSLRGSRRSY